MSKLPQRQASLKAYLTELNIVPVKEYVHPPLNTCQDADELGVKRIGARLKNLFLRDNYGKVHILLIIPADKRVDLKMLSKQQGLSRLGFASKERLKKYLQLEPGCVSGLAAMNDAEHAVQVWLDEELESEPLWQCHPFHNAYTWVLNLKDLKCFWHATGHQVTWLKCPSV